MDGEELTFDEILADAKYQAEFDKRVAKAIEKANVAKENEYKQKEIDFAKREEEIRQSVLEDMEAKTKEAEENAKLSEAERYKKEMDKMTQTNLEMKRRLDIIDRQDKINKYVSEKGYSPKILKLVDAKSMTDSEIESKVDAINATFSETVSGELNEKLKEAGDTALGKKGGNGDGPDFNFDFQPIKSTK